VIHYLYVEDNDEIREAFADLMEAPHRKITPVADAEAALALAGVQSFDALITDVSLPGMSGTDLARHWLAEDKTRWVVLCSGYEFRHGLDTIGPNVRAFLKTAEPEDLDAVLEEIETALARGARPAGPAQAPAA
jgi:two-component system cell cycle response regulator CpdR